MPALIPAIISFTEVTGLLIFYTSTVGFLLVSSLIIPQSAVLSSGGRLDSRSEKKHRSLRLFSSVNVR
nr:MAG TPA: hypothetical protein [Caudoviricetes sp.]